MTDPRLQPGNCHKCGLPMSANPHPEAGRPSHYLKVGVPKECIPCLVLSRHQWAARAMKAENELKDIEDITDLSKMEEIDWNEIAKRGLLKRINREIMHPLGLAVYRDPDTGVSGGALIAPDGKWVYAEDAEPENLDEAVKVFEQAACHQSYKMREGVAAVLRYATLEKSATQLPTRNIEAVLRLAYDQNYRGHAAASEELDALKSQPHDNARDAERYRFARDNIRTDHNLPGMYYLSDTGKTWDKTIDSAMKEAK
jgi:hypothetical protein